MAEETSENQTTTTAPADNDIYTMPKEFYVKQKEKSNKTLIITIGVVGVLAVFGGATAFVLLSGRDTEPQELIPIDDVIEQETQEVQPPVVNEDQNPGSNEDVLEETDEPQSDVPPITTDTLPEALLASVDRDGDGLTDIEEQLLGIDPDIADTDGDGFLDGAEVLSGFDPGAPQARLESSALFKTFANVTPSFTVQVPNGWIEKRSLSEGDRVSFVATNNDSVSFTVLPNENELSSDAWFTEAYPTRTTSELTNRTVAGVSVKESIRRREVYIPIGDTVVVVTYDVAGKKELAYPSIFEYILDSISF